MKTFITIVWIVTSALMLLLSAGCHKKPDAQPPTSTNPTTTTPPPVAPPSNPPPVTSCQGATIVNSLPIDTIADNSSKAFTVTGFDISCGDFLDVQVRNPMSPPGQGWIALGNTPNGASFYETSGQIVTVHNATGITVEVSITATLK